MFRALLLATAWYAFALAADFDVLDKAAFEKLFPPDAKVERLATDLQFTEGPVWIATGGGYLVFSDIPADELKRWDPNKGVSTFRKPSHNANGNTVDAQGRLVTADTAPIASHARRRMARWSRSSKPSKEKTSIRLMTWW